MKFTYLTVFVLLVLLSGRYVPASADTVLPDRMDPAQMRELDADKENIGGPFPGALVVPHGVLTVTKDNRPYPFACCGYIAERATGRDAVQDYALRFKVHVPEAKSLPVARQVARLLLLLLGESRERLRYDHPNNGDDGQTVDVWLMQQAETGVSPDAGGRQVKDNIFIYNIAAARTPIEWTREVAHEYGHYALPGVSGFTSPEEWANGVLGERLYLKWLRADLSGGKLKPADVPFVTPEQLDDYLRRQVTPLLRRIAREGVDPHSLTRRDAAGMDAYTGLALYVDTVYGSGALLDAFSYTAPRQGTALIQAPDFLRGVFASLTGATEFQITPPAVAQEGRTAAFMVYLPPGGFTVTTEGPVRAWHFAADAKGVYPQGKDRLLVNRGDWRKLTVTLTADAPARLAFHRQGTEVP